MFTLRYQEEHIRIYEYKDAKHLIARLSDIYGGDKTLVARGGRGRNVIEYYNYPCSFDIETTTIKPGELDYKAGKDAPPIAFPYLFQFNLYGRVIMCRHYREAVQIFGQISKYFKLGGNRRLIFFIHNASYEYGFWRELWNIIPEECFAVDERHPVTIITRDGFVFRDSYKMTNMSLETLTKDWSKKYVKQKEIMDYSILRTPYTKLDNNTLLYSALDVLSLSDAIGEFLKARNEPIWTKCPTSTSFIRKELKKRIGVGIKHRTEEQKKYFEILKAQRIDKDIWHLLERAARGGNTHANRFYTGQLLSDLVHYDIVSSYPAQMVCYPEYPLGEWRPIAIGSEPRKIELFERNGYCTLFDIALINAELKPGVSVPYISISKMGIIRGSGMRCNDNGRYIGGLEAIKLSIFGIEWPIIKAQYNFSNAVILKGYYARKGYLPDIIRRYVLELYAKKTELKNVENKGIEYALAKTYVNGCFGMMYYKPVSRTTYKVTPAGIITTPPEDLDKEIERYQNSVGYFLVYSWGALVAALGRVYLSKMIDACYYDQNDYSKGSSFVYCDTDSIFALKTGNTEKKIEELNQRITEYQHKCGMQLIYKDIKGKDHELGSIGREKNCEFFKTFGAKKYITVEDGKLTCTIAGVPKKAGSRLIGTPDRFQLGFNFKGTDTGKNCLWYNPAPDFKLHDDQGRPIEVHSNVAMLPCDYLLSMSKDYIECLSIEGNFHWNFKEADKGVINEEDY